MHVSRPIRLPADSTEQAPSERGFFVAVALFTLIALAGSLWLSRHGVVVPCGEDLAAACDPF